MPTSVNDISVSFAHGLVNMLDALRRRSSSATKATLPPPSPATEGLAAMPPPSSPPHPYDTPLANGRCFLSELPSEVLTRTFLKLDRVSLARCFRLCKDLNTFLTGSSPINLHLTLQQNSLLLNPAALLAPSNPDLKPPTSASLLSTLRERLTKFRNFTPKATNSVEFKEAEGNLYEYLEGVLVRGVEPWLRGGRMVNDRVAVYDLRKLSEWEDEETIGSEGGSGSGSVPGTPDVDGEDAVETTESEVGDEMRTLHKFNFEVAEIAIDPGQDLLVIVEVKALHEEGQQQDRRFSMRFHLLTISSFQPHPRAAEPVLTWPDTLSRPRISLGFQIADDGLFVLRHNGGGPHGPADQLCGWQWTTGRQGVSVRATPTMSFESFVLVSPSSFVIPTVMARLDPNSDVQGDIADPSDLVWSHHLRLYAFPPFSSFTPTPRGEPHPPAHTATHVTTIDLPVFHFDLVRAQPPPRMTIRTDPPPRTTFPTHPAGNVAQFAPTPESGVVIIEFHCQTLQTPFPHYVMCLLKSTLAQYLPAPTSPLLSQAFPRPAPVVPWANFAPYVRMLGPNMCSTTWVCYVYQNRYITPHEDIENEMLYMRLFDFDPVRVKKEICDRKYSPRPAITSSSPKTRRHIAFARRISGSFSRGSGDGSDMYSDDGDRDGIVLVTKETVIPKDALLRDGLRTGSKFPYMYVDKETDAEVALIDGERIVAVASDVEEWSDSPMTSLEVMEF